jgi:hypothetical protein
MSSKLYRYTTNGEGTFSAGRRLLDSQPPEFIAKVLEVVKKNKEWLILPELEEGNLEFYWTELGKEKYESGVYLIHKKYLPDIQLETISDEELQGKVVYRDMYQVGVVATNDKSHLPNPYKKQK